MSNESGLWSIIGKISVVITIIAALVGIWLAFSKGSEDLTLQIESGPYAISPRVNAGIHDNLSRFDYPEFGKYLKENFKDEDVDIHVVERVIEKLHKDTWGKIDRFNVNDHRGFAYIVVKNSGEITAKNVNVNLPTSGVALITTHDQNKSVVDFKNTLSIGEVRANNETHIAAWTESELREYQYKEISITHENGVGNVEYKRKVSMFWGRIIEYIYIIPALIYLLFMFGMFFGNRIFKSRKSSNEV